MSIIGTEGAASGTSGNEGSNTGGAGSAGTGDAGAGKAAVNAGTGEIKSWKDSLGEDIRGNPVFSNINDLDTLAKSYIHAQGLVGKKGLIPPTEKSTDEEWGQFYKALGQPDMDKFEVNAPKEQAPSAEVMNKFKETAHKAGLLPKQAQGILDWFLNEEKVNVQAQTEAHKTAVDQEIGKLKAEWGQGYEKQAALATMAAKEVGGPEFIDYLQKTGLAANVQLAKVFAKFGKMMGEDKIRGEDGSRFGQTNDEINNEISKIMADPAYSDRSFGQRHQNLVDQMAKLYQRRTA